eukprot:COSAG05_NODE_483_length_9358_cov_36.727184_6_plen_175_part_00
MHGCDAEFASNGCLLKLKNLFQGPCDMVRREAGCARTPGPELPARAPEPASGQARLPRAARRSESTSESTTDVRASERQQKLVNRQYGSVLYRMRIRLWNRTGRISHAEALMSMSEAVVNSSPLLFRCVFVGDSSIFVTNIFSLILGISVAVLALPDGENPIYMYIMSVDRSNG